MSLPQHNLTVCPLTVGRDLELTTLEQLLALAVRGQGQTALIEGEAGVGKSRLATEATARATALGFTVFQGGCFEQDRSLPYAGLIDLLRTRLPPLLPREAALSLGPLAPLLLGLLPEYAALLPQNPALAALDPEQERQRITQAFLQLFAERARRAPLLLVIEDLHWGDEATLAVLLALARRAPALPLLLLLTFRLEQRSPSTADFVATLGRERRGTLMRLARLTYEQVDAMLRAIFRQQRPIRGDFLSELYNLTEGNPFFIEEVLTALVASGEIFVVDGRWERRPVVELHIPESIQTAVQRHTLSLSPPAQQLASLAAVAGRRFDFELLRRLTGLGEAALLAARLVVEEAPDRFAFRHTLARAALSAALLVREQRAHHHTLMGEYLRQALELARTLGAPTLIAQSLNRYGNWHLIRERVYAYLADFSRHAEWAQSVVRLTLARPGDARGVGAIYRTAERQGWQTDRRPGEPLTRGVPGDTLCQVTELVPGRRLAWRSWVAVPGAQHEGRFTVDLEEVAGDTTLTQTIQLTDNWLGDKVSRFIFKTTPAKAYAQWEASLQNIKLVLEGPGAPVAQADAVKPGGVYVV